MGFHPLQKQPRPIASVIIHFHVRYTRACDPEKEISHQLRGGWLAIRDNTVDRLRCVRIYIYIYVCYVVNVYYSSEEI